MVTPGYTRYERILRKMEPGVDYTAGELAFLSKDSAIGVGGIMRKAVNEGRVIVVGQVRTGCGKGWTNVYRITEGENGN